MFSRPHIRDIGDPFGIGCGGCEVSLQMIAGPMRPDPGEFLPPPPALPAQHFVSRPDLRPPKIRIDTPAHNTAPGLIFLAPKMAVAQAGPMIVDNRGNVVWFKPLDTKGVTDFRVQRYRGKPVVTWWRGRAPMGVGSGSYQSPA